eukprot:11216222-Lingulodinium_polyedra.AAC.1
MHVVASSCLSFKLCLLLGQLCALQPRPRPRMFEEVAHCAGQNASRDARRRAHARDFTRAWPPFYYFHAMNHRRGNPDHTP